jgi:Protein of unknown function (DUF3833)
MSSASSIDRLCAAPRRRRALAWVGAGAVAPLLGACAGPQAQDYARERPELDLRRYFNGPLRAHGLFTDRSGAIVKRFTVELVGRWEGDRGVLEEDFTYSDGKKERRVWRLQRQSASRYIGEADDVVGQAIGESAGNVLRWSYTLRLPLDDRTLDVQFDDWMVLMDDRVMLNRAVMSKFGVRLGEVTLSFQKL